ncbi:MAG: response regulator [Leptospirales bacterium]|nr:response regulator [Leptospirales bacterium]
MRKVLPALLLLFACRPVTAPPSVQAGLIDLRGVDFANTDPIALDGDWEFFPMEFISPGKAVSHSFIAVPGSWNKAPYNGDSLGAHAFGSFRMRILVQTDRPLAFRVGEVGTAYRLICEGQLLGGRGFPSDNPEISVPLTQPATYIFTPHSNQVEVILHVSNFHYRKGGIWHSISFSDANRITDLIVLKQWTSIVVFAMLAILGMYHVAFWFVGRRSFFFFGLVCIDIALRETVTGSKIALLVIPALPWELSIKVEYWTLTWSSGFFALYMNSLFPAFFHRSWTRGMVGLSVLVSIMVLFTPASFYTQTVYLQNGYTALTVLLSVIAATRARMAGFTSATAVLLPGMVLSISVINDILHTNHFINTGNFTSVGLTVFVFGQAVLLGNQFTRSFSQTRTLGRKLRAQKRTLSHFNTRLEEEVKTRTSELELARHKAESAANAKTMFLANMSHELRTPLSSIIGFSELLQREDLNPEESANYMRIVAGNARHLLQLVNEVLDYSKLETGAMRFEKVDFRLRDMILGVIDSESIKAASRGDIVEIEIDAAVPSIVRGDPTRIAQVLYNLVNNAVKFTDNGVIRVEIKALSQDAQTVDLQFSITDTGIGIAQEQRSIIFDRFGQADSGIARKYGGTGLGLAIVQMILQALGSSLQLESSPGNGSRFYFHLKFEKGGEAATILEAPVSNERLAGIRVLVVDDNEINRMLAEKLLQRWGATVDGAADGEEGVRKAQSSAYDVILMDLQMPGMDGYEAARRIRDLGIKTPLIALSAAALDEVKDRALEAGMDDFVSKPFHQEELYSRLVQHTSPDVRKNH